jgi:hypothetical protein
MQHSNRITLIIFLLIIILAGGEGYLFLMLTRASANVPPSRGAPRAAISTATSTPNAVSVLTSEASLQVRGTIQSVRTNSITVLHDGSSVATINVSKDTIIVREGGPKSAAQYASDMQQFNTNVQKLAEEWQQGQTETAPPTLIEPSPDIETSITFSDLAPGQLVNIISQLDADGNFVAQKIIVE